MKNISFKLLCVAVLFVLGCGSSSEELEPECGDAGEVVSCECTVGVSGYKRCFVDRWTPCSCWDEDASPSTKWEPCGQ